MDAVIKAAVKEELRRQVTQSQEQTQPRTVSERQNPAGNGLSNRTVTRLSGLLDRVRSGSKTSSNGKKRKIDKSLDPLQWRHKNIRNCSPKERWRESFYRL